MVLSPYKSKYMRVTIDDGVIIQQMLGCVNLVNMEVLHEGGIEGKYGQDPSTPIKPWNRHAIGMARCKFTIQRWYKADINGDMDLLYNLHDNNTLFDLSEFLVPKALSSTTGFCGLQIQNCISYQYSVITGSTEDIIGEEISGEGLISECLYYSDGHYYIGSLSGEMFITGCDDVKDCLEGDYSAWAVSWQQTSIRAWVTTLTANETSDVLTWNDNYNYLLYRHKLSDGTLLSSEATGSFATWVNTQLVSALGTYHAVLVYLTLIPYLRIYKNDVLAQEVDLNAVFGWTGSNTNRFVSISRDGKYILVCDSGTPQTIVLYKGS